MKKLFFSLVLMFFVFAGTVRVYGFYQDTKTTQITEVNTYQLLTQNLVTENDKNLVPKGSILGVNDVEEIVFEYQVFVQTDFEIDYSVNNLGIGDYEIDQDLVHLFNFDFAKVVVKKDSIQTDLFTDDQEGDIVKVTLKVSMNQLTYEQYQLLANQPLSFDVIFSAK